MKYCENINLLWDSINLQDSITILLNMKHMEFVLNSLSFILVHPFILNIEVFVHVCLWLSVCVSMYVCLCGCLCGCLCLCVCSCGGQKWVLGPLESELQVAGKCVTGAYQLCSNPLREKRTLWLPSHHSRPSSSSERKRAPQPAL